MTSGKLKSYLAKKFGNIRFIIIDRNCSKTDRFIRLMWKIVRSRLENNDRTNLVIVKLVFTSRVVVLRELIRGHGALIE